MKRTIIVLTLAVLTTSMFCSCNHKKDKNGFYTAESGLKYKFIEKNKDAKIVTMGDLVEGEALARFENDTIGGNMGHPDILARVEDDWFAGGINEAFLMMHEGDRAIFGISADSVAKFMEPSQMPKGYKPGQDMRYYYEIHITRILTSEDIAKREAEYMAKMEKQRQEEHAQIDKYVADNNITAKPNDKGLYVIVKKAGTGKKATTGSTISVKYAGYMLNGKMFDTNIESLAKANGRANGHFQPVAFTLGQHSVISGWDEGLIGLNKGSEVKLIIPSSMAYGATGAGAGAEIPPYTPLVFDVEVLAVN